LQDRYEVGVVNRMKFDWWVLQGADFAAGDPLFEMWAKRRFGLYTSNGAVLAITKRSSKAQAVPDLFMFAVLGLFRGYVPGYSTLFAKHHNYLTWAILKAHTRNVGGRVRLRSADPRRTPEIDFNYFGEQYGNEDLDAVVDGIKFVRTLEAALADYVEEEELPGKQVQTDDELRQFVRNNAWGHHASCTCQMAPREQGGVLDSEFRVYGTRNLRVVDASVFPKIPGFFIVTSIYMAAEKAADVILKSARRSRSVSAASA
jgi:choline dehydrogenase-like flavoprotein